MSRTRPQQTSRYGNRHREERDEPVLPDITQDERAAAWGDEPDQRDLEWYRRERPPHHE